MLQISPWEDEEAPDKNEEEVRTEEERHERIAQAKKRDLIYEDKYRKVIPWTENDPEIGVFSG